MTLLPVPWGDEDVIHLAGPLDEPDAGGLVVAVKGPLDAVTGTIICELTS